MRQRLDIKIARSGFRLKPLSFWLFLIAITMSEIMVVYSLPVIGIACYWVLLLYAIIQPVFNTNNRSSNLLLGLSMIPLIRIISISLPLINIPQVLWYPLIYAPLLAAAIVVMHVTGLKASDIGFIWKRIYLQIPIGIIVGLGIGLWEYIILRPKPLPSAFSLESVWLPALMLFLTTGLVEEIIFRGVLQKLAIPLLGSFWSMLFLSIIFAVLHFGFYSSMDVLLVFMVAMVFAIAVKTTGSIWGVFFAHGTANVILFTVAPFILS